jgi:hypothetical protein
VFIRAYVSVAEARLGIGNWITFYNDERKHQALGYRTPSEIFAKTGACAYVDNARALTTSTQTQQQPTEKDLNHQSWKTVRLLSSSRMAPAMLSSMLLRSKA